ncbi:Yip1-domain-containing protein [Annulohypoxylon truncatum]|uniref:Yip1-domain-containing protein n=1 Tax=Annulohypoxylon truncatum TaxID=327061 RepID=UPI002008713A|nr:Yip1-domain-containing protein [Annulohypoxylon truncatum]KAI1211238.1 Yip1-domain-containing protein [Annulohypoxylon truncatum]
MSQYYGAPPPNQFVGGAAAAQNLQFYPSSYSPGVPGQATAAQSYGYGAPTPGPSGYGGFGAAPGVSGRMGEQGGLRTGWLAAFSTEGYDGEPPLLEELGVNFDHIQMKTLAVLNPFGRIDQHIMDDSDLGGPILFFLLFGTFLLFSGKVHFGYIYGLALMGSVALHTILSLMSPDDASSTSSAVPAYSATPGYPGDPSAGGRDDNKVHSSNNLTFARSASVLGYCLLPLVMTSLVGIVVPMDGPLGYILTSAAIVWCTTSASGMFCAVGRMMQMRALVAYPLMLFYVGFGLMSIFSSRGSGSLGKAAGVS